jgi:hypothetical protein
VTRGFVRFCSERVWSSGRPATTPVGGGAVNDRNVAGGSSAARGCADPAHLSRVLRTPRSSRPAVRSFCPYERPGPHTPGTLNPGVCKPGALSAPPAHTPPQARPRVHLGSSRRPVVRPLGSDPWFRGQGSHAWGAVSARTGRPPARTDGYPRNGRRGPPRAATPSPAKRRRAPRPRPQTCAIARARKPRLPTERSRPIELIPLSRHSLSKIL